MPHSDAGNTSEREVSANGRGLVVPGNLTMNQSCSRAGTRVVRRTVPGITEAIERAQAQLASLRFDRP